MENSSNKILTLDQRITKDLNELNTIGEIQDAILLDGLIEAKPGPQKINKLCSRKRNFYCCRFWWYFD